jgi:comEA protein
MQESNKYARGARLRAWLAPIGVVALSFLLIGTATAATEAAARKSSGASVSGVVNVNTASREELQLLPGVGKVRAGAILETRKQRGGFKTVDDLKSVSGIGDSMLDRMRPHVTLKGKTTARRGGSSSADGAGAR